MLIGRPDELLEGTRDDEPLGIPGDRLPCDRLAPPEPRYARTRVAGIAALILARVGKVLCYVVRDGRLLVFRHRDHPDAGVQVPAGTLHEGEAPDAGALRETEEETGYRGYRIVAKLGVYDYEFRDTFRGIERHELHERHVFHLEPPPDLPESWSHLAEEGNGDFWFEFSWVPHGPALVLAGEQHAYLPALKPGGRRAS